MLGVTAEIGSTGLLALKPGEGIESVDGFCRGLNALDELADISSQVLNRKYPRLGPIRVSCKLKHKKLGTICRSTNNKILGMKR